MYKRLFTFGCSLTRFDWPTWADIVAYDQQIEFHNYGLAGIGNTAIASLMIECDLKYKFTDTDLILVNWSSWHREDRVDSIGKWVQSGNIFNTHNYDKRFIKQYWNEQNDIVKNTDAIIGANKMFNIHYQSHMTDYEGEFEIGSKIYDFSNQLYRLESMPNKNLFDASSNSRFDGTIAIDNHPDIVCHLTHAKKVYKEIEMTLDERTIDKYKNLQRVIIQDLEDNNLRGHVNKNWQNFQKFFSNDKYM